jgi:hypothetical protein
MDGRWQCSVRSLFRLILSSLTDDVSLTTAWIVDGELFGSHFPVSSVLLYLPLTRRVPLHQRLSSSPGRFRRSPTLQQHTDFAMVSSQVKAFARKTSHRSLRFYHVRGRAASRVCYNHTGSSTLTGMGWVYTSLGIQSGACGSSSHSQRSSTQSEPRAMTVEVSPVCSRKGTVANARTDWSLRSLFGSAVERSCPAAASSTIRILLAANSTIVPPFDSVSEDGYASYDVATGEVNPLCQKDTIS